MAKVHLQQVTVGKKLLGFLNLADRKMSLTIHILESVTGQALRDLDFRLIPLECMGHRIRVLSYRMSILGNTVVLDDINFVNVD